MFPVVLFLVEN